MTGFMKMLQVQSVVPHLQDGVLRVVSFTDFVFQHENDRADEDYSVDPLAHAGDIEFKIDFAAGVN